MLFSSVVSILPRSKLVTDGRFDGFSMLTLAILAFIMGHTYAFSSIPDVSALKAVSWGVAIVALTTGWSSFNIYERLLLFQQLYWGLCVVIVFSLPLLVLPVGYLRNGSGFQGLINHPQAFGILVAIVGAITIGKLLSDQKPSWLALLFSMLCLVLTFLSEARTAGLALVLGLLFSVLTLSPLSTKKHTSPIKAIKHLNFYILILPLAIALVFAWPLVVQNISAYISKSGGAETSGLFEAYDLSRGFLIEAMIYNIKQNPFIGIGFGIPSHQFFMSIQRDPIFNLPVGAAIEKGVMPLALLEELGLIGFSLFLLWFSIIIRSAARSGLVPLCVVFTSLLITMGESIFFSPGGMGMLLLIFVGWAYSMGLES